VNLSITHSLEVLPAEVLDFVDKIHTFFGFPQRNANLLKLQKENNFDVLLLRKYIKTQWLSLSNSLTRLLQIWDSLKLYMTNIMPQNNHVQQKMKGFQSLMENDLLKLKLQFLSFVVNKINEFSIKLQNQAFNLEVLSLEMEICFRSIFQLVSKPENYETSLNELVKFNWLNQEIRRENFMDEESFTKTLITLISLLFDY